MNLIQRVRRFRCGSLVENKFWLAIYRSFHARDPTRNSRRGFSFEKIGEPCIVWKVACAHGPCIFALIKSRENTFNFFPFSLSFFPPFSSLPANFPEKSRGKWCSWLRFCETVVFSGVSHVEINRFEGNRVIFFVSHFVKCHSLIRRGKMEKFHERWLNMS